MKRMQKIFSSRTIYFLICSLILLNRFWQAWGPGYDNGKLIMWDTYGYYLYLPSTFIYHDPGMKDRKWTDKLQNTYNPSSFLYQVYEGADGKRVDRYPMGMAVSWLPGFLIAHALAGTFGFPADGLSPPYSWAILISGLIYAFIGLRFLRKILLKFFSDGITSCTLMLITLGTNYWAQVASDGVMPHCILFSLDTLILWNTIRWHETNKRIHMIAIGALLGLTTISRPTEIIWIIVPLLWNVKSISSFREKFSLFRKYFSQLVIAFLCFAFFIFLQCAYWKFTSGSWITYTYDVKFSLLRPFFVNGLFSYKKGWLLYTPMMIAAIAGFFFVYQKRRDLFLSLFIFAFINVWVILSWECWWYAACFSNRALVQMYPVMAIALGFFVTQLSVSPMKFLKICGSFLLSFFLALNLFQNWQYDHGILDGERMTRSYYWSVFGKTTLQAEQRDLLDPVRFPFPEIFPGGDEFSSREILQCNFESSNVVSKGIVTDSIAHSGNRCLHLARNAELTEVMNKSYTDLSSHDYAWVRFEAWVCCSDSSTHGKEAPIIVMDYDANDHSIKNDYDHIDSAGVLPLKWKHISFDFITPTPLYRNDSVKIMLWNISHNDLFLDDVKITSFEPKEDL